MLTFLGALRGGWHALPREIAAWWRVRAALEAELGEDVADQPALAAAGAVCWWASERDGEIAIETEDHAHA